MMLIDLFLPAGSDLLFYCRRPRFGVHRAGGGSDYLPMRDARRAAR